MIICMCNNFNDKAVNAYLATAAAENKPAKICEVYKACANGAKPDCGTCGKTLKDMVDQHNQKITDPTPHKT